MNKKSDAEVPELAEADAMAKKAKTKAKLGSFKSRVMQGIGDGNIDEAMAEVTKKVTACEESILASEKEERAVSEEVSEAQTAMELAAQKVEAVVRQESLALEKLRAAKLARGEGVKGLAQAEQDSSEMLKVIKILELDLAGREQVTELEEAKKRAQEAAEAARKALEESKQREKEALEAMKRVQKEQSQKEGEAIRDPAGKHKPGAEASKKERRAEEKEAMIELTQIEKERAQRERERQQKWREAAGLGKGKGKGGLQMLTMGPAASPKRPASSSLPATDGAASKVPKVQDLS